MRLSQPQQALGRGPDAAGGTSWDEQLAAECVTELLLGGRVEEVTARLVTPPGVEESVSELVTDSETKPVPSELLT